MSASGVKYLLASRLNQDCLENLFSIIRGKGGNRDNPSVTEFRVALHQTMVDMLFQTTNNSNNKNCEDDLDHFLFSLSLPTCKPTNTTPITTQELIVQGEKGIGEIERLYMYLGAPPENKIDQELNLQNENVIGYISGFIVKKLKDRLCHICYVNISGNNEDTNLANLTFLKNKLYSEDCTVGLQVPSQNLIGMCLVLEAAYNKFSKQLFQSIDLKRTLFWKLKNSFEQESFFCDNSCETLDKIINIFINIRLHHSLKLFNQEFAKTNRKRNRKMLKLNHE